MVKINLNGVGFFETHPSLECAGIGILSTWRDD